MWSNLVNAGIKMFVQPKIWLVLYPLMSQLLENQYIEANNLAQELLLL